MEIIRGGISEIKNSIKFSNSQNSLMYYKNQKDPWDVQFEQNLVEDNDKMIALQKQMDARKKFELAEIDRQNRLKAQKDYDRETQEILAN